MTHSTVLVLGVVRQGATHCKNDPNNPKSLSRAALFSFFVVFYNKNESPTRLLSFVAIRPCPDDTDTDGTTGEASDSAISDGWPSPQNVVQS